MTPAEWQEQLNTYFRSFDLDLAFSPEQIQENRNSGEFGDVNSDLQLEAEIAFEKGKTPQEFTLDYFL